MGTLRSLAEVVAEVVAELPDDATDDDLVEAVRHRLSLVEHEAWAREALAQAIDAAARSFVEVPA